MSDTNRQELVGVQRFYAVIISRALLISFAITSVVQCLAQKPQQPADVVQNLYHEVVSFHPMGIPEGSAKAAIWPLLSERLIKAFDTRIACDQDWQRQHPEAKTPPYILKPPGVYEIGLFSGGDEAGYVNGAKVVSTRKQPDGSYMANVRLWSYLDDGLPELRTQKIYRWRVGVRVIWENRRFAVDDILFLKGSLGSDKSIYMSKVITQDCNGSHAISDADVIAQ